MSHNLLAMSSSSHSLSGSGEALRQTFVVEMCTILSKELQSPTCTLAGGTGGRPTPLPHVSSQKVSVHAHSVKKEFCSPKTAPNEF